MIVVNRDPLHVTTDDGVDLVTESAPGEFRFTLPRGYRDAAALQNMVAGIIDERLMRDVPDPEASLKHWTKVFRGRRVQP